MSTFLEITLFDFATNGFGSQRVSFSGIIFKQYKYTCDATECRTSEVNLCENGSGRANTKISKNC